MTSIKASLTFKSCVYKFGDHVFHNYLVLKISHHEKRFATTCIFHKCLYTWRLRTSCCEQTQCVPWTDAEFKNTNVNITIPTTPSLDGRVYASLGLYVWSRAEQNESFAWADFHVMFTQQEMKHATPKFWKQKDFGYLNRSFTVTEVLFFCA